MKTNLKLLAAAAVIGTFGLTDGAFAQTADTETGNATVLLEAPIVLTPVNTLDFGDVLVDATGSTLTMNPATSVVSQTGAFGLSGTPAAGSFTLTGDANRAITITLPANATLSPATVTAADLTMDTFTTDAGGTPTIDGTGNFAFNVGANLVVPGSQPSDTYNGTYSVTVDYN